MSENLKPKDHLFWKSGGKAPFFHAFCCQYWAELGNLVGQSRDPIESLKQTPAALPKIETYILHLLLKGGHGAGDTSKTSEVQLLMASWDRDMRTNSTSSVMPDNERRFAITLQANDQKRRFTREYLIGRHGTLQTTHLVNNEGTDSLVSRRGIARGEVKNLKSLMRGLRHNEHVQAVNSLRQHSARRADEIIASFSESPVPQQANLNILDILWVDGRNIEYLARSVDNFRNLQAAKLPTVGERELLHDRFQVVGSFIATIGAIGSAGQAS